MKKFMKTCLIIILVFFGAGLTMLIAGIAMGGNDAITGVVNSATNGRVKVNLDPSSDSFGISAGDFSTDDIKEKVMGLLDHQIYSIEDFTTKFEKNMEILSGDVAKFRVAGGDVEKLDFSLAGCEMTIEPSEDGDFWVEAKNVGKLQVFTKGDTLKLISTVKKKKISGSDVKDVKVILYVPENFVFDEVSMELGAGRIRMEEFHSKKAKFEIGAGEMVIQKLECDNLELEIGAGSAKLENANIGKVKCGVGAGTVSINGRLDGDAKIECAAGTVTLKLANSATDFDYKIECAAGTVQVADKHYSGLGKSEKIDNDADHDLEIECAAGTVKVQFE